MNCSKCGERILPGELFYYCSEHKNICLCEKCADRMQRACPYDNDPLDSSTISY